MQIQQTISQQSHMFKIEPRKKHATSTDSKTVKQPEGFSFQKKTTLVQSHLAYQEGIGSIAQYKTPCISIALIRQQNTAWCLTVCFHTKSVVKSMMYHCRLLPLGHPNMIINLTTRTSGMHEAVCDQGSYNVLRPRMLIVKDEENIRDTTKSYTTNRAYIFECSEPQSD